MTKSYVVSGQGARFGDSLCWVPANVEIHFYVPRLRPPVIYKARTILDSLMVDVGVFPDHIALPGEPILAHCCWASDGGSVPSGVFRRSTGVRVMDLAGTTETRPVLLEHIVDVVARGRRNKTTVVHWLVPTKHLDETPPGLVPSRPERARGDESDESEHIAIARF